MQKEYGSDFHYIDFPIESISDSIQSIYPNSVLFFSGRVALFNLIQLGIKLYKWEKVFLPDYYCHDVDEFLKPLKIETCYYNDGPYEKNLADFDSIDRSTNVFVHVNYFGFSAGSKLLLKNAFIIEDHTHDLKSDWAINSNAHYCFASLRKSLPIPAGGIIWSPKKLEIPAKLAENELTNMVTYMKLSGMLLKRIYLKNGNVNKQTFRSLYLNSESFFETQETNAALPPTIVDDINKIPVQILREHKIKNYKYLSEAIKAKNIIWHQALNENQCPFGMILYFEDEQKRNGMKQHLIENNIYPAVLWPNQTALKARDFSAKSLLIHCDIRYTLDDMKIIADVVNNYKYAG